MYTVGKLSELWCLLLRCSSYLYWSQWGDFFGHQYIQFQYHQRTYQQLDSSKWWSNWNKPKNIISWVVFFTQMPLECVWDDIFSWSQKSIYSFGVPEFFLRKNDKSNICQNCSEKCWQFLIKILKFYLHF